MTHLTPAEIDAGLKACEANQADTLDERAELCYRCLSQLRDLAQRDERLVKKWREEAGELIKTDDILLRSNGRGLHQAADELESSP